MTGVVSPARQDQGGVNMPAHNSSAQDWAVAYLARGFSVVPVAAREKRPAIAWRAFEKKAAPRGVVVDWFEGPRAAHGVGIITGTVSGNIFVVDVDIGPGKEGDDTLRALQLRHDDLPETPEVRTGSGGRHLYFRAPPGVLVKTGTNILGPGVDVRGEGGFVVAPPSVHPSGEPYVWFWQFTLDDVPIADAPAWLLDLVRVEAPRPVAPPPRPSSSASTTASRSASTGSLGVLPPRVEDGRETYMRDTVRAVFTQLTGEAGAWPTAEELAAACAPQIERKVDLSRDGRIGPTTWRQELMTKCRAIVAKAEAGRMGTLEDAVAAHEARRGADRAHGPENGQQSASSAGPYRARSLPIVFADEIGEAIDLDDFVEGLLLSNCLALVFGAPKAGKTFWTLDLAMHVATGRRWRGREVDRGAVLYLALEGTAGIRNRVAAWLKHHDAGAEDAAFATVPVTLDLLHGDGDIRAVIAAAFDVREHFGLPVRLIVLDTVARALGGGDENGPDMGLLVRGLDRIRDETGAAVLAIHHPRKDGTGGERGHGALRGALDIRIEVTRDDDTETSCAKVIEARELEPGAVFPFQLESVELGTNKRGKAITSCVPVPTDAVETRPRGPRITGAAAIARTALANILATSGQKVVREGIPAGVPTVTVEAWRAEAYRAGISIGDAEAQRKAFSRATEKLLGARVAVIRDDLAWLP
jgi:hypothetical protein